MGTVNLGRVGFVPKGEYAAATAYKKYDIVSYNGNNYVAQVACTGVTPGTDATKWKLFIDNTAAINATTAANNAASAATAAAATAENAVALIASAYDPPYEEGDYCTNNGALYRANIDIPEGEAWTAAHWTEVDAMGEVADVKADLTEKTGVIVDYTSAFTFSDGKYVNYTTGALSTGTQMLPSYTNAFVPIPDGYEKIRLMMITQSDTAKRGMAFYTDQQVYDSGIPNGIISSGYGAKMVEIDIPATAKYLKTTWFSTTHELYNEYTFKAELVKYGTYDNRFANIESGLVSRIAGKKVSIIGASIDTYDQEGYKIDGYATTYPSATYGVLNVNETWWKRVLDASGAVIEVNASYSGSQATRDPAHPDWPDFFDRVSLLGNPDVIFVTLGVNDAGDAVTLGDYDYETDYTLLSESEFRPAYIKGMSGLRANYPNADIICIAELASATPYNMSIKEIANHFGAEYVEIFPYDAPVDNLHPGVEGMRQLASHMLYPVDNTHSQERIPASGVSVGVVQGQIDNLGLNLFDKNTVTPGKYINSNGKLNNAPNTAPSVVSAIMPVTPGTTLLFSHHMNSTSRYNAFLDMQGHLLTGGLFPSNAENITKVVPEGAAYIRCTVYEPYVNDFRVTVKDSVEDFMATAIPEKRYTLKDHGTAVDGYTHCAFPTMCVFAGKEIIAYRASMSHYTPVDPNNWGGVMLEARDADGSWTHIGMLNPGSVTFTGELRDPKLSVSRDGKTLFLSCFTTYYVNDDTANPYHENVIFTLDESLTVTGGYVESPTQQLMWGNVLQTPNGHLLVATYEFDSNYGVKLYRSTTPFTGDISSMTFEVVATLPGNNGQEPTIGYFNNYLICLIRIPSAGALLAYTENLEGNSGWSTPTAPVGGLVLHAPVLLPYYHGEYLPFAGAQRISSSLRKTVMGLIQFDASNETNPATWKTVEFVYPDMGNYSGYCGMTYRGGDEFDIVCYQESSSDLRTLGAQTEIWYKRVNMRMLSAAMAYM